MCCCFFFHRFSKFFWLLLCDESDRGHTITAKKLTKSVNLHQKTKEYIKCKSPLFILQEKV